MINQSDPIKDYTVTLSRLDHCLKNDFYAKIRNKQPAWVIVDSEDSYVFNITHWIALKQHYKFTSVHVCSQLPLQKCTKNVQND